MSARHKGFIVTALAVGGLLAAGLLSLLAVSLFGLPGQYPHASLSGVRAPSLRAELRGGCLEWTWLSKTLYSAAGNQPQVLGWFKDHGWMTNYRYDDSVLRQTSRQSGSVGIAAAEEIFVETGAGGARFVASTQVTLSFGKC